jgi:hypothetical protein
MRLLRRALCIRSLRFMLKAWKHVMHKVCRLRPGGSGWTATCSRWIFCRAQASFEEHQNTCGLMIWFFSHCFLRENLFFCVCVFWQQLPPVGRREANTSVAKMVVKPWSGSVRREVRMEQPLDIKKTEAAMKASCVCLCMAAVCSFSLIGVYFGEELYLLSFIATRKQCTHIHLWTHPMVPEREERLHVYLSV